ncbi:MAG: tyrosine-protein phosphatase [Actinomycetes bacterium]
MPLSTPASSPVSTDEAWALATHPERLIGLQTSHNFRDLGGYPTANGHMKWGVLFRADSMHHLNDADLALIGELGIRNVVDLRSADELRDRGQFPVDKYEVNFHNHSILDLTWSEDDVPVTDDPMEFLLWAYPEMLGNGSTRFADAVKTLANANGPTIFHCAAGKDRTGLLAMMVLGSLGCDHEYIIADYEQSDSAMERLTNWAKSHSKELADRIGVTPASFLRADGRAMRIIIDGLVAEHGSLRNYTKAIGVSEETLVELEQKLVQ